jgi:hypothetical protein
MQSIEIVRARVYESRAAGGHLSGQTLEPRPWLEIGAGGPKFSSS